MPVLPSRRRAATIVARNYVGQARVLAASFLEHHPDIAFSTVVIDGDEADRSIAGAGEILLPSDLPIDARDLELMRSIYDVMEYATALKPALLTSLLRRGARSAAYIDPDIRVFAPFPDVFDAAEEHGAALTPHNLHPIPRDGMRIDERHIMDAGMYNLGFLCVGAQSLDLTAWWHERLLTDAIVDPAQGLFTDQRWIDWVPSLFGNAVLRDRGLNVAYWNVHERPVSRVDGRWLAGGAPLRFFHFSGYDPSTPWALSKHFGHLPRVDLADHPELRALCDDYAEALRTVGHLETRTATYRGDVLPNGIVMTGQVRRHVRALWVDARARDVELDVPGPYSQPEAFREWLVAPRFGEGGILAHAHMAIWASRPDLRAAFPAPMGPDAERFAGWCIGDPDVHGWLATIDALPTVDAAAAPSRRRFGWSIVAYATSELGIGEAGRRMATAIAATGLPSELLSTSFGSSSRTSHVPRSTLREHRRYENVISCVNADQIGALSPMLRLDRLEGKHIGYWFWELSDFPERSPGFAAVDEIWTATRFTRDAIAAVTDLPVHAVRMPVHVPESPTAYTRTSLGMPEDRFVLLTNFDYFSIPARKNPMGVIDAYTRAFGPDDGATLIVKSINGHRVPAAAERVRAHAAGRPDVRFVDAYLTSAQMTGMIELADVYVSLHRAEGYGLNLSDAMARATPTIATAYSGNLDFQSEDTAMLVPWTLREVGPDAGPYPATATWADPHVDAAALAMRRLFDDRALGEDIARRGLAELREHHSIRATADGVARLLGMQGGHA